MTANLLTRHPAASAVTLYATCLLAAWFTELLSAVPGAGISIWLPAGFLLAAATATPMQKWPLWALASASAEVTGNILWYGHEWGPAMLLVSGNVISALAGAWCIRAMVTDRFIFGTVRGAALFLVVAALVMPTISATIGSVALGWSYENSPFAAWLRILLGDATGAAVAAPLALLFFGAAARQRPLSLRRKIEATALVIVFLTMAALSLGGFLPLAFLMISPMLWASLRFRIAGATLAVAALTILTAFFTVADISPFAGKAVYGIYGPQGLQLFLLVSATTALLVGAIAEENREAVGQLYSSNRTLEDRDVERLANLAASEARARETAILLAAIGEACPDLIYAKNLDHDIIYANGATLVALGLDRPAELIGQSEEPHINVAGEYAFIRSNDEQVIASGETMIVEEAVTNGEGERRIYRSTKAPLYDGDGKLSGVAGVSVDITDIKKSEARERMLVREVEHRARNLLAVVQGVVQLTHADTVPAFKAALGKRIRALAKTNAAITASASQGTSLLAILHEELLPYEDDAGTRVILSGDDISLDPASAQSLTLVIHELTTNAAKYGALTSDTGRLDVRWTCEKTNERNQTLTLKWSERGGPATTPPERKGFGTTVITAFGQERTGSSVDLKWLPTGLEATLVVPMTMAKASDPLSEYSSVQTA